MPGLKVVNYFNIPTHKKGKAIPVTGREDS
jgi:hypothetical protein